MIKLVVAEDHPVYRTGIKALLALNDGIRIVGEAEDGKQALEMVLAKNPDVLLLDMEMPGLGGLDVVQRLRTADSNTQILILSGYAQFENVVLAMNAGVSGYILKDESLQVITQSIERVFHGGISISRKISDMVLQQAPASTTDRLSISSRIEWLIGLGMTPTLFNVLHMVANGLNDSEIGAIVHCSPHTVRNYISRLRSITSCTWRPKLVAWYWKKEIFMIEEADFTLAYQQIP